MRLKHAACTLALPLLLTSGVAGAAEMLSFGGFSHHYNRNLDLNEVNPGIGYEKDVNDDWSWSAGVFKNSLRRAAFYGLANYAVWKPAESWRVGISAGASTGYHHAAVIPVVTPFLEWRGDKLALQTYVIPTVKPYVDGAVVVQFKWRFR